MAINIFTKYTSAKVAPPTIDMPYGLFRNVAVNADGTGTPMEAEWLNDWYGFFQALLVDAGVPPSGIRDNVNSSDYLTSLKRVFRKSGETSDRPMLTVNEDDVGFVFFDTTLGHPIWWSGTGWVDSTGSTV